jgi:hypothetical protein
MNVFYKKKCLIRLYIHQKYLTELKEQKLYITNKVVIDYVNSLDVKLLLQSINYNIKHREVDVIYVSNIV